MTKRFPLALAILSCCATWATAQDINMKLHDQIGTVTSSFTKGMISSIIPAHGVAREHVRGFQLDLTATNGNSGGPVFSLARCPGTPPPNGVYAQPLWVKDISTGLAACNPCNMSRSARKSTPKGGPET